MKKTGIAVILFLLLCGIIMSFDIYKDISESKHNAQTTSEVSNTFKCRIESSNGFGTCLYHLTEHLGVEEIVKVTNHTHACEYARATGTATIYVRPETTNLRRLLENIEYRATLEHTQEFDQYSPAKELFDTIGATYTQDFWTGKKISMDLNHLSEENQTAIDDYINSHAANLDYNQRAFVNDFYMATDNGNLLSHINMQRSDHNGTIVQTFTTAESILAKDIINDTSIISIDCR